MTEGTLRSHDSPGDDNDQGSQKKRLRVFSNCYAIIPSLPVTLKKGNVVGAEGRGPRPNSDGDSKIYRLAVPILK